MNTAIRKALVTGTERIAGWSELLDRINVFPVADGDTGRNLVLSLRPLLWDTGQPEKLVEQLLLSARGNSGNIAVSFFSGFLETESIDTLPESARRGNEMAWKAIPDPQQGTILSFFEAFCHALDEYRPDSGNRWVSDVLDHLQTTVDATTDQLQKLKKAGVVDSGALGMFIFFDGFLNELAGDPSQLRPIAEIFGGKLDLAPSWENAVPDEGFCVDAVLRTGQGDNKRLLKEMGESTAAIDCGEYVKIHFHTKDEEEAKKQASRLGSIVSWESDDIDKQNRTFLASRPNPPIHIMTDAAGSITRQDASIMDITLLDSYISSGFESSPETHLRPTDVYNSMKKGVKLSTSQASTFERHQHYERVLALHDKVLYLCVGSTYTGNLQTVLNWKQENDPNERLSVIDTGAACGRLGLIALMTARFASTAEDIDAILAFAEEMVTSCKEYIFIDKLKYLKAGGRISKTSAFFGNMLHLKPVINPSSEGVKKAAVLRDQKDQIPFALKMLENFTDPCKAFTIMLEYTDNEEWVKNVPAIEIANRFPSAEILAQPFSLTSGVHMGPGTWGMAFLPNPTLTGQCSVLREKDPET
ncbi:DegV family protein [Thermodesulfobacteriota bacterium]